jgi:methyltransferase family protein
MSVPERCCGSADQLPFRDGVFDLVLSTEMLEHLPHEIYANVLREISRVAARNILITVPNRENLTEQLAQCGACGYRFHVWGHVRTYSPKSLRGLFPGFRLQRVSQLGDSLQRYNPLLLWVRPHVAGAWAWDERTPCYRCSSQVRCSPRWPLAVRVCDHLSSQLRMPLSRGPRWLLALYERETASRSGN